MSFFISSRSLLGSILSSQTDPSTLKHVDLLKGLLTFLKKQRFRSKDGFESVLGLSRAPFGSSWGSPGGLLGAPSGFWIDQRGPPDSFWNSLGPRLLAYCCFGSCLFVLRSSMFSFFFSQRILSQKWREKKRRKSETPVPRVVKERASSKVLFKKSKVS